jgi:hypothetical protein
MTWISSMGGAEGRGSANWTGSIATHFVADRLSQMILESSLVCLCGVLVFTLASALKVSHWPTNAEKLFRFSDFQAQQVSGGILLLSTQRPSPRLRAWQPRAPPTQPIRDARSLASPFARALHFLQSRQNGAAVGRSGVLVSIDRGGAPSVCRSSVIKYVMHSISTF